MNDPVPDALPDLPFVGGIMTTVSYVRIDEHGYPQFAYLPQYGFWKHTDLGGRPRKRRVNGRLLPMAVRAGSNSRKRRLLREWRRAGRWT